jgi:NAD(P)-binding Rossmann-like domain
VGGIETDYLIVGAGAAGMAFADALVAAGDADVVMVDRRHRPGGHWNDAYPFVRLHGPSALYGVNSQSLGSDTIEQAGPNAGYYPRATAAEICAYFQRVLDEQLLPSGRVRFFGMSDCVSAGRGEHRFVSRLTGDETTVRVRRRVVDARYLEPSIPATHVPPFDAEPGVRLIPVNDLVGLDGPASGFTVIGGGKTAMDACLWLLEAGVPPEAIRWIRPREAWLLDRAFQQPLERVPRLIEGVSLYLEAAAQADGVGDLFRRLEACGQLIRLDPDIEPTMFRCATVSEAELVRLRSIENIVRRGRVRRIGPDQIELAGGSIPADRGQVHVDCSAPGLRTGPGRPVFADGRITLQQIRACQPVFSAALTGYVEAARDDDAQKNRLCPANPYPDTALDWIPVTCTAQRAEVVWAGDPDLSSWMQRSRLNATCAVRDHLDDPLMKSGLARLFTNIEPAIAKLETFMAEIPQAGANRTAAVR